MATTAETVNDFYNFITSLGTKSVTTFKESFLPGLREIFNTVQEVDAQAVSVAKSFGQGRENILSIKTSLVDAAYSVEALGGKFSDVAKIQNELTGTLNRAVLLSSDSYEKIFAATQVTGQEAGTLFTKFKNIGTSAYGVAEGMQKIVDTARQQGLSVAAVSQQAVNNMEAMNKYTFQGGVDGLAKMAAQATSLRIDMGTTLRFSEDLYKPEKAIEMSAALQRLGVTQSELLDPLRLMDLSINDPTELQNQLVQMTQQFVTMNEAGQFEIAPEGKLRMRELSQATGIAYDEMTKMALGSAELENKLSKIRFPEFMNEDQQKMIANLAEMKDGEYVITIDGQTQKLSDILSRTDNPEELNKILEAAKPKTMEDLASEQLDLQKSMEASLAKIAHRTSRALATTNIIEELGKATREGYQGLTDIITERDVLSSRTIRDLINENSSEVGDLLQRGMSGEDVDLQGTALDMFNSIKGAGETTFENLALNFNEKMASISDKGGMEAKALNQVADYIKELTGYDIRGNVKGPDEGQKVQTTKTEKEKTKDEESNMMSAWSTVDVNIKLEVPPGMSETEVINALRTEQIKQEIVKVVEEKYPDLKFKPK
jgi:hypothetical protein